MSRLLAKCDLISTPAVFAVGACSVAKTKITKTTTRC